MTMSCMLRVLMMAAAPIAALGVFAAPANASPSSAPVPAGTETPVLQSAAGARAHAAG
ncbi:hypothetical protein [Actinoplanes utahensis]|uniref:hypothetical protein n=1 Tax=Actinoplanes utahensis TaxID=1869 RepID=UPI000AC4DD1E|nr:hypothetical protein [Actinoplanes utahensis]GIF28406.1 hypothetical protein Aut01nite_13920 [Actinoplanes utahensis]